MIPKQLRTMATGAAAILGGLFILNLASSATIATLRLATEAKRVTVQNPTTSSSIEILFLFANEADYSSWDLWQRKVALPCGVCKGKGFYMCRLCKGNSTIEWSPLYDPVAINPCLCPTCDGNRLVELSLNSAVVLVSAYQVQIQVLGQHFSFFYWTNFVMLL